MGEQRPRRPRSPRWAKALIALGVVILLSASTALVGGQFLAARYSDSLQRSTLLGPESRRDAPERKALKGPLNYLLVGTDERSGSKGPGGRSDTIIMVHIPASLDRAYLISVPRDLRVKIPPFPPTGFTGDTSKINAAFPYGGGGTGGVQLLSETLTRLTGVTFDGAAVIDFSGFNRIVTELGGVRICVDKRVRSVHTGHVFEAGCQNLTAAEALDYLRQRKTLPGGDFDRQRHQQQFLRAIFSSVFSGGLATNPLKLDRVLRAIGSSMTVDLGGVPVDQLAYTLRNIRSDDLTGVRVPAGARQIGGTSYVVATADAPGLYRAIRTDTVATWVRTHPAWVNAL